MKNSHLDTHFERVVPEQYEQVFYLNAKKAKIGILFNLIAIAVTALTVVIAAIPVSGFWAYVGSIGMVRYLITYAAFMLAMLLYIVLHELAHGAVYKLMTGEKLTYGFSWSCAFCGVPNIYVYRKCAILSAAAPLVIFTVVLLPVTVALYFVDPLSYILSAFLLGLHLGGCCGDIYLICTLLFRFRNPKTLVRDTGPEQTIFVPKE